MRWLRWTLCGVCALLILPGCQTLSGVNNLVNSVVGTAVKTATKALNAETYKRANSSTTAKQDAKAYKTWAERYADQYQNSGNVNSSGKAHHRSKSATKVKQRPKRDIAYTRYGVEVYKPKKVRGHRNHAPTNPYWQE